jgi:hypothetical protein
MTARNSQDRSQSLQLRGQTPEFSRTLLVRL